MGTVYQEPPPSHRLQPLRVTVQSTSLVLPTSKETQLANNSMFLSNIDQVLNFHVQTVHFFAPKEDFPPRLVSEKLKRALGEILVPYDFLAGRLKPNPETGRLEIECNGKGAGFVVASSGCTLEELGDWYPNPAFHLLIANTLPQHDHPLCIIQVTSFKCGGFAIGISTNHATMDGLSFKMFLDNLAALAGGNPLPRPPCKDRRLLSARSPPRVTFHHPELVDVAPAGVFRSTEEELELSLFRLASADVRMLKERAGASGFNAVAALVWKCRAASEGEQDPERVSTMLYAVNMRPRMEPPLPESYAGNAVLSAYASATCKELGEWPPGKVAERVREGASRMSDEYARSVIDWGQLHKEGGPHGDLLVSSWWRLGLQQVDYPWGRPSYSCPAVSGRGRKDIVLLLPGVDDGVNVLVALPAPQMHRFRACFQAAVNSISD